MSRPGPRGTLLCDVCDRPQRTLGIYTDSRNWAVCYRCFEKADKISEAEGRWPRDEDFARMLEDRIT